MNQPAPGLTSAQASVTLSPPLPPTSPHSYLGWPGLSRSLWFSYQYYSPEKAFNTYEFLSCTGFFPPQPKQPWLTVLVITLQGSWLWNSLQKIQVNCQWWTTSWFCVGRGCSWEPFQRSTINHCSLKKLLWGLL